MESPRVFDALQYCAWKPRIFAEMREGGLEAVHATIAYHEGFRAAVDRLTEWHGRFRAHSQLIAHAASGSDLDAARRNGRIAVLLGFQTPAPIEADLALLELWKRLGIAAMQITYNQQSLLGAGCYEEVDGGLTAMGREAVAEMNRLGILVDLSHAGERTALDAIERSERPVAATHSNPADWMKVPRNLSDRVISALAETGGMMGLSLYPHHLAGGSACRLENFCAMVARLAERHGTRLIGIGSDLCQGQPDDVVAWMRNGRWRRRQEPAAFPEQPAWFVSNLSWPGIAAGLRGAGFSAEEVAAIMGGNWRRFFAEALEPAL